MIDSLFSPTYSSTGMMSSGIEDADVGETSLVLQFFHSSGVLLGLGLRAGVPCLLSLPSEFHDVLAGCQPTNHSSITSTFSLDETRDPASRTGGASMASAGTRQLMTACAFSLRQGVSSIYPDAALDLLRAADMKYLLQGAPFIANPDTLRRGATYEQGVGADDAHVQLWWICVAELPLVKIKALLHAVWAQRVVPDELLLAPLATVSLFAPRPLAASSVNVPSSAFSSPSSTLLLPLPFCIMPPTALALLSADSTDISVFSDRDAISLPRYSSLAVMQAKLHVLLARL